MNYPTDSEIERFVKKIRMGSSGECWPWVASTMKGYGQFVRDDKSHITATRLAYRMWVGDFPDHLYILHSCDNPLCSNPDHLRAGTQKENLSDMDSRGRRNPARGVRNGRARISADTVIRIRAMRTEAGMTYSEIATYLGLGVDHVCKIVSGKLWAHVH